MQIAKDVYQLSGVPMRTNSNSYIINAGNQLILIDAGFSDIQWNKMQEMLDFWELDKLPITYTFFTHCHYDHAGNAWKAREIHSKILAGPSDAEGMEKGDNRCIGYLFQKEYKPCPVDHILKDGEEFFIGNAKLKAYHMPGHSKGSMIFSVNIHEKCILFTGDFLAIEPVAPKDDINVLLAWTGGSDFSAEDYLGSLKRASEFDADILCPGHYHILYSECSRVLKMAYEKGKADL